MKQHVKESEILTSSDDFVSKLIKLVYKDSPHQLVEFKIKQFRRFSMGSKELSVDLTIGKMIELLNDFPNNYITNMCPGHNSKTKSYVELGIKDVMAEENNVDSWFLKGYHSKELCDALWKAVKEIL